MDNNYKTCSFSYPPGDAHSSSQTPGPVPFWNCLCSTFWDQFFFQTLRVFSGLGTFNIHCTFLISFGKNILFCSCTPFAIRSSATEWSTTVYNWMDNNCLFTGLFPGTERLALFVKIRKDLGSLVPVNAPNCQQTDSFLQTTPIDFTGSTISYDWTEWFCVLWNWLLPTQNLILMQGVLDIWILGTPN